MYFLRHGNTERQDELQKILESYDYEYDMKRNLTAKGRQQARRRKRQLGNPVFDLCVVSPPKRCKQTAEILLGDSQIEMIEVPTLYPAPEGEAGKLMWEVFRELLYAPLSVYLESKIGEVMVENGKVNAEAIRRIIANYPAEPQRILIVDHAVTLQATGQNFTIERWPFSRSVGEVEGFMIDAPSKTATIIKDSSI